MKNSTLVVVGDNVKIYKFLGQEEKKKEVRLGYSSFLKKLIIFKDKDLIAVNKPSGIAVQGGSKVKINIDSLLDTLRFGLDEKPKLVHRIDKQTSGLLLIARNLKCAKFLGEAFKARKIKKKYLLIVRGLIKNKSGEINMPIITNKKQNTSITNYTLITKSNEKSLILASPITGRKHQIRKHFSIMGNPIIGDQKFGVGKQIIFSYSFCVEFENERKKLIKISAPIPDYFREMISEMNFSIEEIEKNFL